MPSLWRSLLLAFGLLTLLASVQTLRGGFDLNLWWIDLRPLPSSLAAAATALVAAACLLWCFRPRWRLCALAPAGAAGVCLVNSVGYYTLRSSGELHASPAIPLSLIAAALMLTLAALPFFRPAITHRGRLRAWTTLPTLALLCLALPLLQMHLFGRTDYRRPADAIVVFGARTYADGRPSDALRDRVLTGIELYHAGLAPQLIFSGGPGDGAIHETDTMRTLALQRGVPDAAIIIDRDGLNTRATIDNLPPDRAYLAVSHFYHLPRIKMAAQQSRLRLYTVPADEAYTLTKLPLLMLREVAALWAYYF